MSATERVLAAVTTPHWALGVDPIAAGIDYLIGDPADRGRGLGSTMIRAFAAGAFGARSPLAPGVCSAVRGEGRVVAGVGKAGFRFVGIIDDDEGPRTDGQRVHVLRDGTLTAEARARDGRLVFDVDLIGAHRLRVEPDRLPDRPQRGVKGACGERDGSR